jgi:hypothetical protein
MTYQTGIDRFSAGRIAVALLATLAVFIVFAFSTARPVSATNPGNNGTVKIHEGDGEPAPGHIEPNEPKVCTFHVHAWNFDEGQTLILEIVGHGGPNAGSSSYSGNIVTDFEGEHGWEDRTDLITLEPGMYKLTVDTGNGTPTQDKHKVFKVECETGGGGDDDDDDAGLNILKFVEGTETRLPGAVFEIVGLGTYTTDENGQICILGLPHDSEWLVREIQAPEGYEIIEAEQMVEVDDDGSGLCDSPDAVFYNRPIEGGGDDDDDDAGDGGTNPDSGGRPREGTLGGNPLPNTAMEVSAVGTTPAALALLALSGVGLVGLGVGLEIRRRQ